MPGSTDLKANGVRSNLFSPQAWFRPTHLLSFNTGPPLMSTSNRWIFWYLWVISPRSSIHSTVFFTL